jgi:hypothetical protein
MQDDSAIDSHCLGSSLQEPPMISAAENIARIDYSVPSNFTKPLLSEVIIF